MTDASSQGKLTIQGAKVHFIMGKDTIIVMSNKQGVASYEKRVKTPKVEIVVSAEGYRSHSSTMDSPKPGNPANRQVFLKKSGD